MSLKERIKNWAIAEAQSKKGGFWLALLSFAESSFFPIPPDVLLIAILLSKQERRWVFYSFITTIFSVLGGIFGYLIGLVFFAALGNLIVGLYGLQDEMEYVTKLFNDNAFLAIFLAAFTPIPYKVFTISAGLFGVNIFTFILASVLGRGLRFFAEGLVLRIYGPKIADLLYRYFNIFSIVAVTLFALLIYFVF